MNATLMHAVIRLTDSRTSDSELLERFVRDRDELAFEELVRRHGPLVWSVCRHLLPHHADAEDAFQAVFLALVRSAGAIRAGQALPAWLHGVAVRVAAKVKRGAVRRRQREQRVSIPEADRSVPDGTWSALMTAVHEEVRELPDAERTAFVLCDLEGVRQPDAAARLGWPLGTLSGRLCKARQRLLEQLTRRGIAPGVLAVGGVAATAGTVPAALLKQVCSFPVAKAGVSSTVAELARGLVEGVTMRTKVLAATLLVAGALGVGGGAMVLSRADAQGLPASSGYGQAAGGAASAGGVGSGGLLAGQPAPQVADAPRTGGGSNAPRAPGMAGPGPSTVQYKFAMKPATVEEFITLLNNAAKNQGLEYIGESPYDGVNWKSIQKTNLIGDDNPNARAILIFKRVGPRGGGFGLGGPTGGAFFSGMPGNGEGGFSGLGGSGMMMPGGFAERMSGILGSEGGIGRGGMALGGLGGMMGGADGRDIDALTFKLKNAKSGDVARSVERAFPKAKMLNVISEPTSNMVVVVADPATLKEAKKLIESLDKQGQTGAGGGRGGSAFGPRGGGGTSSGGGGGGGGSFGPSGSGSAGAGSGPVGPRGGAAPRDPANSGAITIYSLKNAQATELAGVLGRVFPTAHITADERTNQLIVRVSEKDAAEFEALVQRLDVLSPRK